MCKTTIQFGFLSVCELKGLFVLNDAVPNLFDKLDSIGYGEPADLGRER